MTKLRPFSLSALALLIGVTCCGERCALASQVDRSIQGKPPLQTARATEHKGGSASCQVEADKRTTDKLLHSREYRKAVKLLKHNQECAPKDEDIQDKLVFAYLKCKLVKEAREQAKNATLGAPLERKIRIAHVLNSGGDFSEVQAILKEAIDSGDDSAPVHAELGRAYLGQKEYEDSVRQLGRAVQLNPETESYSIDLASALLSWGNFPTALKFLEAVRGRFGNSPKFLYDQAWAYYGLRQTAHTVEILQTVVQTEPDWDLAHYSLGNAFSMLGDLAGAEKQYRSAISLDESNVDYHIALGRFLRERDAVTDAITVLTKAMNLDPHNM